MAIREESDSIGLTEVPQEVYYGIQSLRVKNNSHIIGRLLHSEFIKNLVRIKKAAVFTNMTAYVLDERTGSAIVRACGEIIGDKLHPQFIVDAIQGGAGTSTNMNANKVIANRTTETLGGGKGDYSIVHPNDHVNVAQSTSDVIPCVGKLTTLDLLSGLTDELDRLQKTLHRKFIEFDDMVKTGRTQLQDTVPTRLGQSFEVYAAVIGRDIRCIREQMDELEYLNIGVTAVGTVINANSVYLFHIIRNIGLVCGTDCVQADDLFDATRNLGCFVHTSSALRICVVNLSRICNDLRLLSSGSRVGLGGINLSPKQNGSSIMPSKINPVIPEVVSQVAFNVIGNGATAIMAAEARQTELNAFEPMIFYKIFESIDTTKGAAEILIDNCIFGITANREHCRKLAKPSAALAIVLCPTLGYKKSAEIVKRSIETGVPVRRLVLEERLTIEAQLDQCLNLKDMTQSRHQVEYHKTGEASTQSYKES